MRVRPKRTSTPRRSVRRLHLRPERAAPVAQDAAPPVDELRGERRVRESGGPIDRAQYACSCGYVFDAAVSTSVACPHCGTPQAW